MGLSIPISPASECLQWRELLGYGVDEIAHHDMPEIEAFDGNRRDYIDQAACARLLSGMQNCAWPSVSPQPSPDVLIRRRSAVSGRCLFPNIKSFAPHR